MLSAIYLLLKGELALSEQMLISLDRHRQPSALLPKDTTTETWTANALGVKDIDPSNIYDDYEEPPSSLQLLAGKPPLSDCRYDPQLIQRMHVWRGVVPVASPSVSPVEERPSPRIEAPRAEESGEITHPEIPPVEPKRSSPRAGAIFGELTPGMGAIFLVVIVLVTVALEWTCSSSPWREGLRSPGLIKTSHC
jgi:hypothetical protein